ncbi:hypothetical protein ACFFQW_01960 [Umezawaea endophytica]|uniref:Uncharacterized protein n=1 Tax=Umezawaea endophytica TaxID=1654476 RepID=A0A9X2ZZ41_9PSEU|nr:hypothetical protein [Umezawaea endophytica]MCS7477014.1 hypothetical protein [Umezawaea endophytica]
MSLIERLRLSTMSWQESPPVIVGVGYSTFACLIDATRAFAAALAGPDHGEGPSRSGWIARGCVIRLGYGRVPVERES